MPAISITEYLELPAKDGPSSFKEFGGLDMYRLKWEVFSAYSPTGLPQCSRCGIEDLRVLTLDHINRDGAAMRKDLMGDERLGGIAYYHKMRKLNFPPGHQTLCSNCHRIVEWERCYRKPPTEP